MGDVVTPGIELTEAKFRSGLPRTNCEDEKIYYYDLDELTRRLVVQYYFRHLDENMARNTLDFWTNPNPDPRLPDRDPTSPIAEEYQRFFEPKTRGE